MGLREDDKFQNRRDNKMVKNRTLKFQELSDITKPAKKVRRFKTLPRGKILRRRHTLLKKVHKKGSDYAKIVII